MSACERVFMSEFSGFRGMWTRADHKKGKRQGWRMWKKNIIYELLVFVHLTFKVNPEVKNEHENYCNFNRKRCHV